MPAFEIIAEARIREPDHKLLKLGLMSGRTVDLDGFPEYRDRIVARLTR